MAGSKGSKPAFGGKKAAPFGGKQATPFGKPSAGSGGAKPPSPSKGKSKGGKC